MTITVIVKGSATKWAPYSYGLTGASLADLTYAQQLVVRVAVLDFVCSCRAFELAPDDSPEWFTAEV
jgi:hypothetical protein